MINLDIVKERICTEIDKRGFNTKWLTLCELLEIAYVRLDLGTTEISEMTKGEASRYTITNLLRACGIRIKDRGGNHGRRKEDI